MRTLIPSLILVMSIATACQEPAGLEVEVPNLTVIQEETNSTGIAVGSVNSITPSTNAINYANGWAHVLQIGPPDLVAGELTLQFVAPRDLQACFEYRLDDEPAAYWFSYNPALSEMWYHECWTGDSGMMTFFSITDHIDIRLVMGDDPGERFDWTRFHLIPPDEGPSEALTKEGCKEGGWEDHGFRNQGQCVRFVETGKDSRDGIDT